MAIASIEHDKISVMAGKVTQKSHCRDKKISVELAHHLFYSDIGVTLSFLCGVITMNLFTGRQARPQASINSLKWLCVWKFWLFISIFCLSGTSYADLIYVTNQVGTSNSHAVSVIDTSTDKIVATIPVKGYSNELVSNPSGTQVYVATGGGVGVIETASNKLIKDITVPGQDVGPIQYLAMDKLGTRVYAAGSQSFSVSVIDTKTNEVISTVPIGRINVSDLKANPSSDDTVYLAAAWLKLLDFSKSNLPETIVDYSNSINVSRIVIVGERIYALDGTDYQGTSKIHVIDTINRKVIETISVALQPLDLVINKSGTRIYVMSSKNGTVSVIDTNSNTVINTIKVSSEYSISDITISPSENLVYVTNSMGKSVVVIDTITNSIVRTISLGDNTPGSIIAINPVSQTQPIITIIPGQGGTPGCGSSNKTHLVIKKQGNGEVVQTNMVCPGPVRKGSENCPVTNTTPYCGDEKVNCSINDTQCSVSYIIDDGYPVVTLTATPAQGHTVNSWEGCDSVSKNKLNCIVTTKRSSTEANTSVTVSFKELPPATFELKVEKTGNGSGTVSGSGSYTEGQRVELSAIPDTNSTFEGWSGDSCTSSFTMPTKDLTCSAKFDKCSYSVDSSSQSVGMNSETGSIRLSTKSGCSWNLSTDESWIKITSDTTGKGETTIKYSIGANSDAISRSATISLNGTPLTSLNQSAAACSYAIEPSTKSEVGETGETGNIRVIATPQCKWEVATDQSWLKINKVDSQSNVVSYQVDANTTLESRTGKISILANQKEQVALGISQKGESCTFKLDEVSKSFSYQGGEQNVAVTASNAKCNWKTSSNVSWLKITSGTKGSGTVKYTVDANQTNQDRTAQVTIADKTFDVIQTATTCIFTDRPNAPKVTLAVKSDFAVLAWNAVENAEEYVLYYAPYPDPSEKDIQSFSLGKDLSISATLAAGTSIYVAVKAKNCVGDSGYSNIETILIPSKLPDAPDGYDAVVLPSGEHKISKEEAWTQEKARTVFYATNLSSQDRANTLKKIAGVKDALCDNATCSVTMNGGRTVNFINTRLLINHDAVPALNLNSLSSLSTRKATRSGNKHTCPAGSRRALIFSSINQTLSPTEEDKKSQDGKKLEYSLQWQGIISEQNKYIAFLLEQDGYLVDTYESKNATHDIFKLIGSEHYGVVYINSHGGADGGIHTGTRVYCLSMIYKDVFVTETDLCFEGIPASSWNQFDLKQKYIHFESCSLFNEESPLQQILLDRNIGAATGFAETMNIGVGTGISVLSQAVGFKGNLDNYDVLDTPKNIIEVLDASKLNYDLFLNWSPERFPKIYFDSAKQNAEHLLLLSKSGEYAANYYIDGDVCHFVEYSVQVRDEAGNAVQNVTVKIVDADKQDEELTKAVTSADLNTAVFELSLDPTEIYVMTISKQGYVTEEIILDKAALEKLAVQTTLYTLKKSQSPSEYTGADRYIASDDGTAYDKVTGLTWMRCSVGQTWNATTKQCDGNATTFTWDEAIKQTSNFADYSNWVLPSISELSSLVFCSNGKPTYFAQTSKTGIGCQGGQNSYITPVVVKEIFPNTPKLDYGGIFWSSSGGGNSPNYLGVAFHLNGNIASTMYRSTKYPIRLVLRDKISLNGSRETESVSLSWDSAVAVKGNKTYNLYRKIEGEAGFSLLKPNLMEASYKDTNLVIKKHCYKVDVSGVASTTSNEFCITPVAKPVSQPCTGWYLNCI